MLDYVLTLVHEVDHAVYYYFNTTIRQIDNKEQSRAMQSSTEAIKALWQVPCKLYVSV